MFIKYPHLERFGTEEVEGIQDGEVYVFPKLDGTNGSVWWKDGVKAGSRNRALSVKNDNAGFCAWAESSTCIQDFLSNNPTLYLYGEWLVPHSLKTYRSDAWRRFYVFDVWDTSQKRFLHYSEWSSLLEGSDIDYLPPLAVYKEGITYEDCLTCVKKNVYLIEEGKGIGEGIVLKNYSFVNRFGRTTWAKVISNAFKEKHHKAIGSSLLDGELIEEKIVRGYITKHLVDKAYAKIVNEKEGWDSKYIPMLLGRVYHDLITEEMWDILKTYKQPRINFKTLQRLATAQVKVLLPEIF